MTVRILNGDCREVLRTLPDESVHCVVTSPPYWGLRDYGVDLQIGLEKTPDEFVASMVGVFQQVKRVLRADGTLWINLGDSYQNAKGQAGGVDPKQPARRHGLRPNDVSIPGLKPKDLVGVPWLVAFALRADGWYLRQDIIWSKPNPMPEPVRDRCVKTHEYLFLLSKSRRYHYDVDAIRKPLADKTFTTFGTERRALGNDALGNVKADNWSKSLKIRTPKLDANGNPAGAVPGSVWKIATQPFPESHFATFPPALVEPCILAGCPKGGVVLDPFGGAGTTGMVADRLGRDAILIELNPEYSAMAEKRLNRDAGMFADVALAQAQDKHE